MRRIARDGRWAFLVGAVVVICACAEEDGAQVATPAPPDRASASPQRPARAEMPPWLLTELHVPATPRPPGETMSVDDECCDEVGQVDDCWMEDAAEDGVLCPTWSGRPAGYSLSCKSALGCGGYTDGVGPLLCRCESDEDCCDDADGDGSCEGDRQGICVIPDGMTSGLCGPSWCNGYKICSCWGGCIPADSQTPLENCQELNPDVGCCEGNYPVLPTSSDDPIGSGYCSDDEECVSGCTEDEDCLDVLPEMECMDIVCEATVCGYAPNTDPCDDGLFCNGPDTCSDGECQDHAGDPCAGGGDCNDTCNEVTDSCLSPIGTPCGDPTDTACDGADTCDGAGACLDNYEAAGASCDDGLFCDGVDNCDGAGECVSAGDPCPPAGADEVDFPCLQCNEALNTCLSPEGTGCDDSDACSQTDACDAIGNCVGGNPVECAEGACYTSECDPATGSCIDSNLPNGTVCYDSNPCDVDACQDGVCEGTPRDCGDGNDCTQDSCQTCTPGSPGCSAYEGSGWKCAYNTTALNGTSCSDGDDCTVGDVCSGGSCASGSAYSCAAFDVSATDCVTSTCQSDGDGTPQCATANLSSGTSCQDGDGCTSPDTCDGSGACVSGAVVTCADANPNDCVVPACVSGGGGTSYTCNDTNATVGTACNDNNGCTTDVCNGSGACVSTNDACGAAPACQTVTCTSTGSATHTCSYAAKPNCCTSGAECAAACGAASTQCSSYSCVMSGSEGTCACNTSSTAACTDFDMYAYPDDCYDGQCSAGSCVPYQVTSSSTHDKCRDLFGTGAIDLFGSFVNGDGQTSISVQGSTTCMSNNYRATGPDCVQGGSSTNYLGKVGKDAVYAFSYQTPSDGDFTLWSYNIKVWSSFNANVYVSQDIDEAADCPEGATGTPSYPVDFDSERCMKAYASATDVSEDLCHDDGNESLGQGGCFPFLQAGDDPDYKCGGSNCTGTWTSSGTHPNGCGYHWVRRYYPAGCCNYQNGEDCAPGSDTTLPYCTGQWDYPADPYNCDVFNPSYTYSKVASHVIFPDTTAAPGSTKYVIIVVDGDAAGQEGVFDISVERQTWTPSPCDRADDDARIFDITDTTAAGSVFRGSMEGAVNSRQILLDCPGNVCDDGLASKCGGTNCSTQCWSGWTTSHSPAVPTWYNCWDTPWPTTTTNEFWPNQEFFKIHRSSGSSTYCVMVLEDEDRDGVNDTNRADLVMMLTTRYSGTGLCSNSVWICGTYDGWSCAGSYVWSNNYGNNIMASFSAGSSNPYMLELTNRDQLTAPCDPSTQSCYYKVRTRLGDCGYEFPAGYHNIFSSSGSSVPIGSGNLASGDGRNWVSGGSWSGYYDEQWELGNSTTASKTVAVSFCPSFNNAHLRVYNSNRSYVSGSDLAVSSGSCGTRSVTIAAGSMVYLVVVGNSSGDYTLSASW